MVKKDMTMLRKTLKKAPNMDGIIDWVYGFYVTPDNSPAWDGAFRYFELDDEEKFRYLALLQKTVSAGIGKDMRPVSVKQQEYLLGLRGAWDTDRMTEALEPLRDLLLTQYAHTDPYYAFIARVLYDVPGRASDGALLEDAGSVCDLLVFSVCPAKLTAPSLGFENDTVADMSRRWAIGNPLFGFVYPSPDDSSENRNEAGFYLKKEEGRAVLDAVFETEAPVPEDNDAEQWTQVLSASDLSQDTVSSLNGFLEESDSEYMDKAELCGIIKEAGGDAEKFGRQYDEIIGDREIARDAITSSSVEIRTGETKIVSASGQAPFLKRKVIDGVEYILVPVDGVVTVNGVSVV